jgi:crotonobetainyl-CoA:carnitine CoA-transferase CaiB-like acyl-CoA transferase
MVGARSDQPLAALKVVELGHIVAGPTASLILAEFGAEVIKIERPGSGDQARANTHNQGHFVSYNSNKQSICLDIGIASDKEVLLRLLDEADVLIDNFAPGALDRAGLAYETLAARNPRLIHASIKGFLPGPDGDMPLTDEPAQMRGGLAYMTGPKGRPLRAGTSIVDITGAMFAVIGVLVALEERNRTGIGRKVDVGLFESVVFLVGQHVAKASMTGEAPEPLAERGMGRDLGWGIYRTFRTRDDRDIFVAVLSDNHWERFCTEFGLHELRADQSLGNNMGRAKQHARLSDIVSALMAQLDFKDAVARLNKARLPCAPVNTPLDLIDDAHLASLEFLKAVRSSDGQQARIASLPVASAKWFEFPRRNPPLLGEHTQEILARLAANYRATKKVVSEPT